MIIKLLFIVLIPIGLFAQGIVDIPAGTKFNFDIKTILEKQKECNQMGDDYRIKNQVHFMNGNMECNGPIFQRSCFVELEEDKKYDKACTFECASIKRHYISLEFAENSCPTLKCRPLMWTGLFTGPDIGAKSLKYNLGKIINFQLETGINKDIRKETDKHQSYTLPRKGTSSRAKSK